MAIKGDKILAYRRHMTLLEISRIITVVASFFITAGLYWQAFKVWETKSANDFSMLLVCAVVFNELAWLNYGIALSEWPITLVSLLNLPAVAILSIGYFKFNHNDNATIENVNIGVRVSDIENHEDVSIKLLTMSEYERAGGHDFFAKMTGRFFSRHPWNERFACLNCKAIDDFTDYMCFTDNKMPCPKCSAELKPFWSVDRFRNYVKDFKVKDFKGYIAWDRSNPVGWITGYSPLEEELPEAYQGNNAPVFYIDLLGTIPAVRRKSGVMGRIREILFLAKMRLSPTELSFIDPFIRIIGLPIVGILYISLLKSVHAEGYQTIVSKTHREAYSVRRLLTLAGFKEIGVDKKNVRLSWWVKGLKVRCAD